MNQSQAIAVIIHAEFAAKERTYSSQRRLRNTATRTKNSIIKITGYLYETET